MNLTARTQELQFSVTGQSLILDCEDGRPSSVTSVSVWAADADDTSTAESATTGSASVESAPNTTISAAAGPAQSDPTALTLTSGSSVAIGRVYKLTEDGTGASEFVEVASISGTSVKLRHPLKNDYSSGSTFQSCRSTISVDSTWVADINNLSRLDTPNATYRVKWVVVVNGQTAIYERYFDLLRYPASHGVTSVDMAREYVDWLDRLPPDHQADQGRALLERAYEGVKRKFYTHDKADQSLRNMELRSWLTMVRANYELHRDNFYRGAQNADVLAFAEREWEAAFQQVIGARVANVDTYGGGAAQPVTPQRATRR